MKRSRAATIVVLLHFACGNSAQKTNDVEPVAEVPAATASSVGSAVKDATKPRGLPVESEALEPPTPSAEAVAAASAAPDEPAEYTAIKARLLRGEGGGARSIKPLQTLSHKYPKSSEIVLLLGQLYLEKLWVDDGLKAFHHALELDPQLRSNPFLIRAVIHGLGNDGDARQVRRFIAKEIGAPAAPYLVEVLYGDWRQQVKDRAKETLEDIP